MPAVAGFPHSNAGIPGCGEFLLNEFRERAPEPVRRGRLEFIAILGFDLACLILSAIIQNAIPRRFCAALSSAGHVLTGSTAPRASLSRSVASSASSARPVDALLAWNMRSPASRATEVAQLKFSDIDWRNGGIRVLRQGSPPGGASTAAGGWRRDFGLCE